ncbi:hypothetical protein PAXRUDRAFT_833008 [Paxillus rubicundulus Ve08.2h10]|uniref:Uncharacterized protein n=1 Tax=Paxillus rubicundulus Ve08.2h10 TaxID=930991 RepID=A0A0D0CEN5_9AGAM|nr:hypothetical protein PAXRUDRAFT_833008 [Paxillus rubicundulus Ve08.2h10]
MVVVTGTDMMVVDKRPLNRRVDYREVTLESDVRSPVMSSRRTKFINNYVTRLSQLERGH